MNEFSKLSTAGVLNRVRSGCFLRMADRLRVSSDLLDNAVGSLLALLPGCLLFPIPRGQTVEAQPLPLLVETQDSAYLTKLATARIAVALGQRSNGLGFVRFPARDDLVRFLERNLAYAQSLVTTHADGLRLWFFTQLPFRRDLQTDALGVQMSGAVMVYDRFNVARPDGFVTTTPPLAVDLTGVNWGDDPTGAIDIWLATICHGSLFAADRRGKTVPSRNGWSDYLARRLRRTNDLRCDAADRRFYTRDSERENWRPCTGTDLLDRLRDLVSQAPVDASLKAGVTDQFLLRLLPRLKTALRVDLGIINGLLTGFLTYTLVKKMGSCVSKPDLFAAFEAYRIARSIPPLPRKVFSRLSRQILERDPWGLTDSASIPGSTGDQNGYWGICLRVGDQEQAA